MSRALVLHLALLVALLAAVAATAVHAVTPPQTPVEPRYEIVEALGATDFIADIASDPRGGRPALAFYDTTRAETLVPTAVPVKLARYDRFSRVITNIGSVNGRTANSRDLRLSIDQTGAAHVLAIETNTLDQGAADDAIIYFGTDAAGAPIREVVDTGNVSDITMAISSTEEPHVAYIKTTEANPNFLRTLTVRRRDGGSWTQVPLDITPTNASAPSFAPSPTEDVAYSLHLAWAETAFSIGAPGGSAIRYARVTGGTFVTETVASHPLSFTLFGPQVVIDAGGNREIIYTATPDPQNPAATTIEIRERAFGASAWTCMDTGCTLPTGPLAPRQVIVGHGFVRGGLVIPGSSNTRILRRESTAWVSYPLSVFTSAMGASRDRLGNIYTVAADQSSHDDLFMVRVGGPWESRGRIPADPAVSLADPLDVSRDDRGHPVVYARRSCCSPDPRGSLWMIGDGDDFVEFALPGAFTVGEASIAIAASGAVHLAIYDEDQDDLVHAVFAPVTGGGPDWTTQRVDLAGDAGRSPSMLIASDGTPMIVYQHDTQELRIATRTPGGTWAIRTMANGLSAASRPLAVTGVDSRVVHASWFDEVAGQLRVSTLHGDSLGTSTIRQDLAPPTVGRVRGRVHALTILGDGGVGVAASEETNGQTRLAYRYRDFTGQWFDPGSQPLEFSNDTISRIAMDSTLLSPAGMRIAWIAGGRLRYAERIIGVAGWRDEDLGALASSSPLHLGATGPLDLTYNDGGGLEVLRRLESIGSTTGITDLLGRTNTIFGYCSCVLPNLEGPEAGCFGDGNGMLPASPAKATLGATAATPPAVLEGMRVLFNGSAAGRYYLQLFSEHAPEIIRLTLSNPSMLYQRTATLSDLIPGFAALVESASAGAQFRFTPDLIANARLVVQQWRDFGSPALRRAVDNEFARTQSFNQFQGMTFTEWFNAISVGNATQNLFNDGFE